MNKRVLVTGGNGALGARLVPLLQARGHEVLVLGREPHALLHNVTYIHADITQKDDLEKKLASVEFDTVLHLAGVTHTHDPQLYFKVNADGTRNLVDVCKHRKVLRFFYMSSRAAERGGGAYAKSKIIAERIVESSGLDWIILRPAEVYGAGSEAILSLARHMQKYHLAPMLGDGSSAVAPVWVDDVLQATVQTIDSAVAKRTYTIAGPQEFTYNDVVDVMAKTLHLRALKVHIPIFVMRILAAIAKRVGSSIIVDDQIDRLMVKKDADISEARRDLGFNPLPLAEGLKKITLQR